MKNSIAKRAFSLMLALVMCFSMLPVSALAVDEEAPEELGEAVPSSVQTEELPGTPTEGVEGAHTHVYEQTELVLPADGEDGYAVYACECGEGYRETLPAEQPVTVGAAELLLPQRADFVCDPADLFLNVYTAENYAAAAAPETPEADGAYLLLPGEYVYTAEAEGYLPAEGSFTVADSALTVSVTLSPVSAITAAPKAALGGALGVSPQVDILIPANFPDAALLTVLRAMYPYGLTAAEAFEITELSIDCEHGTNIDGFELFPNLERLDLYMPGLRELDLSGRTELETLAVLSSELRTLDLSGCTSLVNLSFGNNVLNTVDLEGCTALGDLSLTGCLNSVNLNGCTALKTLVISDYTDWHHEMECLDLSGCPALEELRFYSLRAKKIVLGEQQNLLNLLLTSQLPLQSLDLSGCPNLNYASVENCGLNWLDPAQVDGVYLAAAQNNAVLYGTDDGYTMTVYMDRVMPSYYFNRVSFENGSYDPVTGILTLPSGTERISYTFDLSPYQDPMTVNAIFENEENILTAEYFPDPYFRYSVSQAVHSDFLTREQAAAFSSLYLMLESQTLNTTGLEFFTGVQTLILEGYSGLEDPQLETMTLPVSDSLEYIQLRKFSVKNMYVKDQPYLSRFEMMDNAEVENLFVENCSNLKYVFLSYVAPENVTISRCHALESVTVGEAETGRLRSVTISNCSGLEGISVYGNPNFSSLVLDRCSNLLSLTLWNLPLTELDVSDLEKLELLAIYNCGITALDLKNNTKLRSLSCSDSSLTELDLSNNVALEMLFCDGNEIAELDLRNCKQLKKLECDGNRLYRLDLSANTALTSGSAEGQRPRMSGVTGGEFRCAYLPMYVPYSAFASFSFESDANCKYDASKGYITVPATQTTASYTYATGSSVIPRMTAVAEIDDTVRIQYVNAEHLKPAVPEYNTVTGLIRVGDPTVSQDGRAFTGWYVDDELSEKVGELPMEDADIDLFPGFTVSTYSVFFDPNGGTGELSPMEEIEYLDEFVLPDGGFVRDGCAFEGWNTMPDGSGLSYRGGSTVKNLCGDNIGEVTLYAQWTPSVYRIEFDGNGADGGSMQSSALQCFCGTDYVLPENRFGRSGYVFSGWNTTPDGSGDSYASGETVRDLTFEPNGIVTLYAIWRNTFTVIYNGNGADSGSMADESHRTGETFALKANAYQKEGSAFIGWALASDASYPDYSDGQRIRLGSNTAPTITLYALWKPVTLTIAPPEGTRILYRDDVRVYLDEGFYGIDSLGNFAKGPADTVSYALYLTKSDTLRQFDLPLVDGLGGEILKGQFTLASSNAKVASVKELSAGVLHVEIKAKADGAGAVTAVKKSDRSSTASLAVHVMDYAPRLDQTGVTVNTYKDTYVALPLVESYGNEILSVDVMEYSSSTKKYDQLSERFRSEYVGSDEVRIFPLCAVPNSTVKAALSVKCADGIVYELPLSIISKTTMPKITVTQPKSEAFQLMYKDSVSHVTVKALSGKVEETVLEISVDESYNPVFTGEGFGGEAELRFTPGCEVYDLKNRSVRLELTLEGWNYPVQTTFNLNVDKSKPALITDPASGLIRTALGETYTEFSLVSKATGEVISPDRDALSLPKACAFAELYVVDGKVIAQLTPKLDAKTGAAVYSGGTVQADVQQDNWTSPVRVSFSLSNKYSVPTVKVTGTPVLSSVFPGVVSAASVIFSQSDLRLAEVSAVLNSAPKGTDPAAAASQFSFVCGAVPDTLEASLLGSVDAGTYTFTLTAVAVDPLGSRITASPVDFKVNVGDALPALTLSESSVTLSKVFAGRTAEIEASVPEGFEITALRVEPAVSSYGADKILFDVSGSAVTVSLNPGDIPAGSTYRYNVIADVSGFGGSAEISAVLKIDLDNTLPKAVLESSGVTLSRLFPAASAGFSVGIDTTESCTLTDIEFAPVGTECGKLLFTPDFASGTVEVALNEADLPRNGTYYCRITPVITPDGAEPVALKSVNLKITVNSKAPTVLGLGTITLNTVAEAAGKEEGRLVLSLSDAAFSLSTDSTVPVINCTGSAVQQAEAVKIRMEYDYASHTVKASLDPKNLPKTGRYTFLYAPMIVHEATGQTVELAPVSFTVSVVKKAVSATVKAVGSMDTVRRGSSGITYTLTSLNNLSGELTGNVELAGADGGKFLLADVSFNEDGQLQTLLRLRESEDYSTAVSYGVQLRYEVALASGETTFAETGVLRVRPVQSSCKLTVSPASQTYCQSQDRNRELRYDLDFADAKGIEVESISIGEVKFWQKSLVDQAKDIRIEQGEDSAEIVVVMKDTSIFAAGSKYVLPVTVTLKGAATNAKAEYKANLNLKIIK